MAPTVRSTYICLSLRWQHWEYMLLGYHHETVHDSLATSTWTGEIAWEDALTNEGSVAAHGGHSPKDKHEDVGCGCCLGREGQCGDDHKEGIWLQPKDDACDERVQVACQFDLDGRSAVDGWHPCR